MKDLGICVEKYCDKLRFLDYYVCAEHFVVYAAPRYTDSMLVNPETLASVECPDFRMYPEESCTGGWQEPPPPDPSQGEAAKLARLIRSRTTVAQVPFRPLSAGIDLGLRLAMPPRVFAPPFSPVILSVAKDLSPAFRAASPWLPFDNYAGL
ncbi:MAG TPA: hypothetical protein VKB40_03120 [Candidatus Acidoferrales bacterium]|nr:hypothetical protein [Candidatus Acidoferrales bacterium]